MFKRIVRFYQWIYFDSKVVRFMFHQKEQLINYRFLVITFQLPKTFLPIKDCEDADFCLVFLFFKEKTSN